MFYLNKKALFQIESKSIVAFLLFSTVLVTLQTSCRKLVDIPPPINSITDEAAYSTDISAAAVFTGFYAGMSRPEGGGFIGIDGIPVYTGLSADELFLSTAGGATHASIFRNDLINLVFATNNIWTVFYNYLYRCNAALEGVSASHTLSASAKNQLLGEAYFLRGFLYYHLVNLYGPVPLALNTDYKKNTLLGRS
ncbi:MAG: RagB/SusD family nutrient uptake outer membrane protein, partial [Chitinophagaceae bacterium]|nr:RagB/SusD family nutrient uptake outer membrane protein [Chitinophagaceae bacterium]